MTNIYELKHHVNFYAKDTDEISLIMFNAFIDTYPDQYWPDIFKSYTEKLYLFDPEEIVIYTILSVKLKSMFLTLPDDLIQDLIITLKKYQISPYKLDKIAKFLINHSITEKITYAYNYHLIRPQNIYMSILNAKVIITKNSLEKLIDDYINDNKLVLFDNFYDFEHIYQKLINITNEINKKIDNINYLLEFDNILDESIKNRIKKDFSYIESNDEKSILEKFDDIKTIIDNYKYYISS